MKNIITVIFFLMNFVAMAQIDTKTRMIFPDFMQGTVIFKDGTSTTAPLNYDTYEEEMIFNNNGTIMAVGSPETVSMIEIKGKTFEWLEGDIFLEKMDTAGIVVYRRNRNQLMSKGKGVPFGGVSNNSAVSTVTRMPHGAEGQATDLTADESFELIPDNLFYAKAGSNLKNLIVPKNFSKMYDFDKKKLEEYIKSEKIDLHKVEDIIQVIQHCKNGN